MINLHRRIDLQQGLGAPPIVFPGMPMHHPDAPVANPGNAPVMTINQAGKRALGCMGGDCLGEGEAAPSTVADLRPWFARQPLWLKIGIGVGGAGLLIGLGYGVYRAVR